MAAWDLDFATGRVTPRSATNPSSAMSPVHRRQGLDQADTSRDREEHERAIECERRERAPISREVRFARPDGSIRWVFIQGRFVRNEANEAVRLLGVSMDITERKRSEDALRSSERRYSLLFETMDKAWFTKTPRGALST